MKTIALLLLITIATCQVGMFQEKKFNPNDKNDALALSKAVAAENLEIVKVLKCYRQLVNGWNYYFELELAGNNIHKTPVVSIAFQDIQKKLLGSKSKKASGSFEEVRCNLRDYYIQQALSLGMTQLTESNSSLNYLALYKCYRQLVNGFNFQFEFVVKNLQSGQNEEFLTQPIYVEFAQQQEDLIGGFQVAEFDAQNPMDAKAKELSVQSLNLIENPSNIEIVKCMKKIVNGVFYIFEFKVTNGETSSNMQSEPIFLPIEFEEEKQEVGTFQEKQFDLSNNFDMAALNIAQQKVMNEMNLVGNFHFERVIKCSVQLVNGWNYKFELEFKTSEGLIKSVEVQTYVPFDSAEALEIAGFQPKELAENDEYDQVALNKLVEELKQQNIKLIQVENIYRQLVNGYNYVFDLQVEQNGKTIQYLSGKIYVPFSQL